MKRLIYLVPLLCVLCVGQGILIRSGAAVASGNTWTTSSGWSATGVSSGQISCTNAPGQQCPAVTVPATVAGDLLYVEQIYGGTGGQLSSGSGGGTWVFPANCNNSIASAGSLSCGYVLSATGGVTSITMTLNAGNAVELHFRSYHPSSTTAVAETVPAATTNAACSNNCTTPTVTLTGTSDVVIAAMANQLSNCSVAAPYGNYAAPSGDGIADNLNTASGTGATFSQASVCPSTNNGIATLSTVAFK